MSLKYIKCYHTWHLISIKYPDYIYRVLQCSLVRSAHSARAMLHYLARSPRLTCSHAFKRICLADVFRDFLVSNVLAHALLAHAQNQRCPSADLLP